MDSKRSSEAEHTKLNTVMQERDAAYAEVARLLLEAIVKERDEALATELNTVDSLMQERDAAYLVHSNTKRLLDAVVKERDGANAEIAHLRTEIASTPTWFSYRVEDWADALQSIRLKLKQDAQQIVELIHERNEALTRLERAERVVEAAKKWSESSHVSADDCEACHAEIVLCDALTAWQETRDAR